MFLGLEVCLKKAILHHRSIGAESGLGEADVVDVQDMFVDCVDSDCRL